MKRILGEREVDVCCRERRFGGWRSSMRMLMRLGRVSGGLPNHPLMRWTRSRSCCLRNPALMLGAKKPNPILINNFVFERY